MNAVRQGYTPSPTVEFLDLVYDVRTWLSEAETELHNISNPHCFVLKENANGDIVLKYKNWSRDKTWKPSGATEEGLVILEVSLLTLILQCFSSTFRKSFLCSANAWEFV